MIGPLRERWGQEFGGVAGAVIARAPGRVNLIGEHTDYNDGFVLPCAIDRSIWLMARPRTDRLIRLTSLNYETRREITLEGIRQAADHHWSDYPLGVTAVLLEERFEVGGWDGIFAGDVPVGAGLSSSAAIEMATAVALREMFRLEIDDRRLALLAQRAENTYVGMQCGIMDQFASLFGREDHLLFLDCRTLETREITFRFHDVEIVICDTQVQRELTGSEYNTRRIQCLEGVRLLREHRFPTIKALRDVTPEDIESSRHLLADMIYRRCKHVVTENRRVLETVEALQVGDLQRVGRLMLESHASLRNDYEVSCRELDLLVELAMECGGTIGSRMTGAGFGGCTVSLVRYNALDEFRAQVEAGYERQTGYRPVIVVTRPAPGASIVERL